MIKYFRLQEKLNGDLIICIGDEFHVDNIQFEYVLDSNKHDPRLYDIFERWCKADGYSIDDLKLFALRVGEFRFTPLKIVEVKALQSNGERRIHCISQGSSVYGKVERVWGHNSVQDSLDSFKLLAVFP